MRQKFLARSDVRLLICLDNLWTRLLRNVARITCPRLRLIVYDIRAPGVPQWGHLVITGFV
jgi:hypothetical protein